MIAASFGVIAFRSSDIQRQPNDSTASTGFGKSRDASDQEQDAIAALILEELVDEELRSDSFSRSHPLLAKMAQRVQAESIAGQLQSGGIEEL